MIDTPELAHRIQTENLLRAGRILLYARDKAENTVGQTILEHAMIHVLLPDVIPGPYSVPANIHPKVPHGKCPVCGHYGQDCTGKGKPPADWQCKERK